jgi:pilus assembly protein CpaE
MSRNRPPTPDPAWQVPTKPTAVLIYEDTAQRNLLAANLCELNSIKLLADTGNPIYGYDLIRRNQPAIALIELRHDALATLELVRRITTYVKHTLVIMLGPPPSDALLHACMTAGVRDYLSLPLHPDTFRQCLERHSMLFHPELTTADDSAGRLITVYSNKGGLGKTTMAIHIATALSTVIQQPVALVDLNLQLGDVTTFLDIIPNQTIVDIARNLNRADETYLRNSLHSLHPTPSSHLYVLADPADVEDADDITSTQINSVLTLLKATFPFVVVDAPSTVDARSVVSLDLADDILLTSIVNLPCIRSTQRVMALFERLAYPDDKIKLLINRHVASDELTLADVEEALGRPLYATLANDYFNVMRSINRGIVLPQLDEQCPLWAEFLTLARRLAGIVTTASTSETLTDEARATGVPRVSLLKRWFPSLTGGRVSP